MKQNCFFIIGLLFLSAVVSFCHKPRNGNYIFSEDGTQSVITCPQNASCHSTDYAHSVVYDVKIKTQGKTFMVDDKNWQRDGNNVSYTSVADTKLSPGSTSSYTINYTGKIKHANLIEGTYSIQIKDFSGTTGSTENNTGHFTIKKK